MSVESAKEFLINIGLPYLDSLCIVKKELTPIFESGDREKLKQKIGLLDNTKTVFEKLSSECYKLEGKYNMLDINYNCSGFSIIIEGLSKAKQSIELQENPKEQSIFYDLQKSNVLIETSNGKGSGVIISKETNKVFVLTNRHVAFSGSNLTVKTYGGTKSSAKIAGVLPDDIDLTIISFESDIQDFSIANSSYDYIPKIGEEVRIVGNPYGIELFQGNVVGGIISNVKQTKTQEGYDIYYLITDAPINPGNSGGGVFTLEGKLIGISTAGFLVPGTTTPAEGIKMALSLKTYSQFIPKK